MNLSHNSLLLDEGASRESREYPNNTKDTNILQMSDKKLKNEDNCSPINGAITQALVKINKIHNNQLVLSQDSDRKMTSLQDDATTTATTIT